MSEWRPHPGPQEAFCRSPAYELLYGGQAGGGKSMALLMEALRYVHVPGYQAILFRRTFRELERSLIRESHNWYPGTGGKWNEQKKVWRWPSGAYVWFGHLEHGSSVYEHASAEYAYLGFDELTEFQENQYMFLHSRARTTASIPVRIRAGTNPGGIGHDWVYERWAPWLKVKHEEPAKSGELRHYETGDGADLSRTFIRARLEDNLMLMEADPDYRSRLSALPLVMRQALRDGVWDLTLEGNVFKYAWLQKQVERAPEGLQWVRYYDLAGSLKETASRTASISAALHEGVLYCRRGFADRLEWPEQVKLLRDVMLAEPNVSHGIEEKFHGLAMLQELRRDSSLANIRFQGVSVDRDKLTRAHVWSPRAEEGKVVWVTEDDDGWIPEWVSECVAFDGTGRTFDDRVDAISGCVQMIGVAPQPAFRLIKPPLSRGRFQHEGMASRFVGRR